MPLAGGTWSDGNSEWPRAVALPGLYSFAFAADGCSVSDSIVVTIVDRSYGVELPSVFTPNSDGSNNLFKPITLQGVSSLSFRVYNRWGQEVFHTTQLEAGWVVGHHPASRFRRVPTSGPLRPQPSAVTSLAISSTYTPRQGRGAAPNARPVAVEGCGSGSSAGRIGRTPIPAS